MDEASRMRNHSFFYSFVLLSSFFLLPSFFLSGCGKPLHRNSEFVFGTFVEVISEDPRAKDVVFKEFERLDKIFNLFDPASELAVLNTTAEARASDELFEVLSVSEKYYRQTHGAFDVSIAPVSLLWKKAIHTSSLPSQEEIAEALDSVGFGNVYLDAKTHQVKFLKMGMKIDLGALAKGYALDKASAKLRTLGITNTVINAGGKIICLGTHDGRAWRVGIQDPRLSKHFSGKLELRDKAVGTAGDYEQFFIFQNKRYSHIIDPKTGYPTDKGLISATVVADDALTADALATILILLGKDSGAEFLKNYPRASAKVIDTNDRIYDL